MAQCKVCSAPITFERKANGKWTPIDASGEIHFAVCGKRAARPMQPEPPPSGMDVDLWTDGSTRRNPGPGGYAALIVDPSTGEVIDSVSGFNNQTTNNRMELTAIIRGLAQVDPSRSVAVYSDSQYALIGEKVVKTDKPRHKVNTDLWVELLAVVAKRSAPITWHWVRGHSGITNNEAADELASVAAGISI
jgi:ribonuclease HI